MTNIMDRIFDRTIDGLSRSLDLSWKRNEVISANIANAETPTFRASDVNFGSALEQAFKAQNKEILTTNPQHLDLSSKSGLERIEADLSGVTKPDGNNVDLDLQMGRLAYNAGRFSTAANLIRKQLAVYRNAIRGSSI